MSHSLSDRYFILKHTESTQIILKYQTTDSTTPDPTLVRECPTPGDILVTIKPDSSLCPILPARLIRKVKQIVKIVATKMIVITRCSF